MIREQSVKAILAPLGPTGVRFELTNRSDHREDRRPDVFGQGIPPIDEFLEGLRSRVPGAGHTSGRGGIRFADISRFPVPFRGYFAILVPVRVRCEFWFCRLVRLAAGSISFGVYALWRVLSVRLPGESLARQRRRWKLAGKGGSRTHLEHCYPRAALKTVRATGPYPPPLEMTIYPNTQ